MTDFTFSQIKEQNFPLLKQYTPILARVHGENHPELAQVRDIFAEMNGKAETSEKADLNQEFTQLREVTNNYEIPSDGCETYEATYQMLAAADKAYHAS